MNNENYQRRDNHPPIFDQENNQGLNQDLDQEFLQEDDQSGYNSPNAGGNTRNEYDHARRQDGQMSGDHDSHGTYQDEDLDLSEDDDQGGGYNRPNGAGNYGQNQNDYAHQEDSQVTDNRAPLGSYQDTDQYGNNPSKEDLDDNYDQEGTDGDSRNQDNNSYTTYGV